jgi:glycerol-3-phosphate dehydrogenase
VTEPQFDIAVIGGGINGAGIARDAAGRGAKVLLLERGDLAQGTSSASTKLIHGGLRYLEHYEFGLVREALKERETLWQIAPHIIWPMRFVLPHVRGLRPRWLLRLGLFLYDHIGGRKLLPATDSIDLRRHPAGAALKPGFTRGFEYSDGWVDDARLVVLNVRDAADLGAEVRTRHEVLSITRTDTHWEIQTSQRGLFSAQVIINAAGPAVMDIYRHIAVSDDEQMEPAKAVRLVRGSHIIVRRMFDHGYSYFFQLPDGRIFFAIPYERDFTLIGTTDRDHQAGDPIEASAEEIEYLCNGANEYFNARIGPEDVVRTYSGVRPLVDDGKGRPEAASRGYSFELHARRDAGPVLLSVFGGKITTYRELASEAVDLVEKYWPLRRARGNMHGWTAHVSLPGGDFAVDERGRLIDAVAARYPFFEAAWVERLVSAYGTDVMGIFGDAKTLADCGEHFGCGFTTLELEWMRNREWARKPEDVLWRRSKLGLHLTAEQQARVAAVMQNLD